MALSATRRVVFDPEFEYILGPAVDVAAFWVAVPHAANLTETEPALHSFRTCSTMNMHSTVLSASLLACSTALNLTVSFGGRAWLINDTDMNSGPVAVGSSQCKGVLISDRFAAPATVPNGTWIFGMPFLVRP